MEGHLAGGGGGGEEGSNGGSLSWGEGNEAMEGHLA